MESVLMEGRFSLKVEQPWGEEFSIEGRNLIPIGGSQGFGFRIMNIQNFSEPTHILFGSGGSVPSILDGVMGDEKWAIDCSGPTERGANLLLDGSGFTIYLTKPVQTYTGGAWQLKEAGVGGRAAGKTIVLYSRKLLAGAYSIVDGTKMTPYWELLFQRKV